MADKKIQLGLLTNHKQIFSTLGNHFHQWLYAANDLLFEVFGTDHYLTSQFDNLVSSYMKQIQSANEEPLNTRTILKEQLKQKFSIQALKLFEEAILTLQSDISPTKKERPAWIETTIKVGLLAIGVFFGAVGNQLFFKSNKKYEMKIALAKESIPYYTNLVNFSVNFQHLMLKIDTATGTVYEKYPIPNLGETDGVLYTAFQKPNNREHNIMALIVPAFVVDSEARKQFINDVDEIRKNKSYLDADVWRRFEIAMDFFHKYELPPINSDIRKSSWANVNACKGWDAEMFKLHKFVLTKMNEIL